jgi:hypothetical protein
MQKIKNDPKMARPKSSSNKKNLSALFKSLILKMVGRAGFEPA